MPKCSATSATAGPFDPGGHVVPAHLRSCGMAGGVEAVAVLGREVDAADECDPVVDDDRLLVVAVEGPLARVERDTARASRRPADRASCGHRRGKGERAAAVHLPTRARARRSAPRARPAGVEGPPSRRCARGRSRREAPTRDMDVRAGAPELRRDGRQRFGTVDEHLDRVAGAWRVGSAPSRRVPGRGPVPSRSAVAAARGERRSVCSAGSRTNAPPALSERAAVPATVPLRCGWGMTVTSTRRARCAVPPKTPVGRDSTVVPWREARGWRRPPLQPRRRRRTEAGDRRMRWRRSRTRPSREPGRRSRP